MMDLMIQWWIAYLAVGVFGGKPWMRNESECRWDPQGAPSTDQDLL